MRFAEHLLPRCRPTGAPVPESLGKRNLVFEKETHTPIERRLGIGKGAGMQAMLRYLYTSVQQLIPVLVARRRNMRNV